MSTKLKASIATLLLALTACSSEPSPLLVSIRQNVVNGTLSGPEDDAVVFVTAQQTTSTQSCSATLIAPNLIVTALHCVANYVELTFTCDSEGKLTAGPGGQIGTPVAPEGVEIRTGTKGLGSPVVAYGKQIFASQTTSICLNDIALVVLDRDLAGIPIRPVRLYSGVEHNESLRVVGYGVDENKLFGTRHSRSDLTVDQVGSSNLQPVGDNVPPRSFTSVGGGLCIGDSGGPALSDQGAVMGVYSKVVGVCTADTAIDTFTQIAPFVNDLAMPAFQAAGYEPWLEGNSEPGLYGTGGTPSTGGAAATGGTVATSETTGGAPSTGVGGAPAATGGDTSEPIVYDQGPARGGTCACRAAGAGYRGFGAMLLGSLVMLGLRSRIRRNGRA